MAGAASSGLRPQLCGDAHLLNFGLNDFDETLPGPFEWDVKRLAASFEIAGRALGLSSSDRESVVVGTIRAYREAILEFADRRDLEVWYARLPAEELQDKLTSAADPTTAKEFKREVAKALRRNHLRAFDRLLEHVDGEIRFASALPLLVPIEDLLDHDQRARYVEVVQPFLRQYRESLLPHLRHLLEGYRFAHIARKVVGVGSVGTRARVVLMMGRDTSDPLFLQLKEAKRSVLEPYTEPSVYESQGRRVVEGQRFMQAAATTCWAGTDCRPGTAGTRLRRSPAVGGPSPRSTSRASPGRDCAPTATPAAGPWRGVTRGRVTGSRWPPI